MMEIDLCAGEVELEALQEGNSDGHPGFLLMCATIVVALGISHGIVQVEQLCATIVGFRDTQQVFAPMSLPAGTAKRQGTMQTPAQMKQSVVFASNLGILQRNVILRIGWTLDYAKIAIRLATLLQIARMRRLAIIVANQGTLPRTAGTLPYAIYAI